jgi:hydroxymethylpyrimidine/phosphomethylpyrimidine kinase
VAGLGAAQSLVHELGARSVCVVVGVTAQDAERIYARHPIDAGTIRAQFAALRTAGIAAAHVGALLDVDGVNAVANALEEWGEIPLVCDPVIAATGGDTLADSRTSGISPHSSSAFATAFTPSTSSRAPTCAAAIDSFRARRS